MIRPTIKWHVLYRTCALDGRINLTSFALNEASLIVRRASVKLSVERILQI